MTASQRRETPDLLGPLNVLICLAIGLSFSYLTCLNLLSMSRLPHIWTYLHLYLHY